MTGQRPEQLIHAAGQRNGVGPGAPEACAASTGTAGRERCVGPYFWDSEHRIPNPRHTVGACAPLFFRAAGG